MSETAVNEHYSLIPHVTKPQVLLLVEDARWSLPHHCYNEAPDINRAMKEQLDLDVTLLSCVYDRYHDEDREDTDRVYALESHSPNWTPPTGARWVDRAELDELTLAVPGHRPVLETWFSEIESGDIPVLRVPWARLGWFDTAVTWIQHQLMQRGSMIIGPVEQVHVRLWSCVLRVDTTDGPLYFKAAAPYFGYEPLLTQLLAELWPMHLPGILSVDTDRHWVLMEDAGVQLRSLSNVRAIACWEEVLTLFARMQIESVAHLDVLLACGCPDRRLNMLPQLFENLLADRSAMLIGREGGLTEADYAQLRASAPQIRQMCAELASYKVPEALHHDDFHPGNIMACDGRDGRYIFFDWAESALAHPFYSLIIVLRYAKLVLDFEDAALVRMRDTYLQAWTIYESMERLLEAFRLAQRLGLLCRALTWYHTVSHLEASTKWEAEQTVPHGLRRFLNADGAIVVA